jgi:hypothetical protein
LPLVLLLPALLIGLLAQALVDVAVAARQR